MISLILRRKVWRKLHCIMYSREGEINLKEYF